MKFPRGDDAVLLSAWLLQEYGQATADVFEGWEPSKLLGASEATVKEIAGKSFGGRLFGAMNTIKSNRAAASNNPIEKFLYQNSKLSGRKESANTYFPENGRGDCFLPRKKLVEKILNLAIEGKSVYFRGVTGCGKTQILNSVGQSLSQLANTTVYYFPTASFFESSVYYDIVDKIDALSEIDKIYLLVDEAQANMDSPIFTAFLKTPSQNVNIIAAGIPRKFESKGIMSQLFDITIGMEEILLDIERDVDDINALTDFWIARSKPNTAIIERTLKGSGSIISKPCNEEIEEEERIREICFFLCEYVGGHIFALGLCTYYAFVVASGRKVVSSVLAFKKFIISPSFSITEEYETIKNRCYSSVSFYQADLQMFLSYRECDKEKLFYCGYLKCKKSGEDYEEEVISQLLERIVLESIVAKSRSQSATYRSTTDPKKNLEFVIITGLQNMDSTDFGEPLKFTSSNIENGLGFSWCLKAKMNIPNLYIAAQPRGKTGFVEFYLNGTIEHALALVLNGSKMDEHAQRFADKQYPWPSNAILNFQLEGSDIVLPSKSVKYNHKNIYTFVKSRNALYRGKELIKSAVVTPLKLLSSVEGKKKRSYDEME